MSFDQRVDEPTAAFLLGGLSPKSLQELRLAGIGPASISRGVTARGRVSYRLVDLAEWIEARRQENYFSDNVG